MRIGVFVLHILHEFDSKGVVLVLTANETVEQYAFVVAVERHLVVLYLFYIVEGHSQAGDENAHVYLTHVLPHSFVLLQSGLYGTLLLLELLELSEQFLVFGLETVQQKLVGVQLRVLLQHHLLEFINDIDCAVLVVGSHVVAQGADILLDLTNATVHLSIHSEGIIL
jgi:hypothetical protein